MKTAEMRQDLIKVFINIVNDMTNELFNKISKDITNDGIADIAGKSRKEQIQMFTNKMDNLNREELIKLSNRFAERPKLSKYNE